MSLNRKIAIGFIAVILITNIVGYFILPDTLIMQVNFSGEASTVVSKIIGLLSLTGLGLIGAIYVFKNDNPAQSKRSYLILAIILIVQIMMFVLNL